MVSKVLFSSKSDEWSTPQDLFDALNDSYMEVKMIDKWTLPVNPAVFECVLTCTNASRDYATLICTFIDVWAEDHEIDKVKYAAHIADMVKRKQERDKEVKNGI